MRTDLLQTLDNCSSGGGQPYHQQGGELGCGSRAPQFMIIGAAKSGTTTLYQYLLRHPQIFLPKIKEPEFFSDDTVFNKRIPWYLSLFAPARAGQVCGEASTTYTRWPHTGDAAARIHEAVPSVKLVYIMRHPVERAYAHYAHHMRLKVTMTFEEALSRSTIYVDCSMYMRQIDRYLRYFSKDSFLFLTLDELKAAPANTLAKLEAFLGIEPMDLLERGRIHSNERHSEFIRHHTTQKLRQLPGGALVAYALPEEWKNRIHDWIAGSAVASLLRKKHPIRAMLPETRTSLLRHFAEPNHRLAEFLNWDLSTWDR